MTDLKKDIETLLAGLADGSDLSELSFESEEIGGLARDLARRGNRSRAGAPAGARARSARERHRSSMSELQKILDLCRVIAGSQDLKDILRHLLFLLSEILPSRGCAVFVGDGSDAAGDAPASPAPLLSSNFTPALQQALAQHIEEGIIAWALKERRVCLIPSFEERPSEGGDFAIIPLSDNDRHRGFIWIACTIKQEEVDPEMANLLWVLSSHASIAIMNCLHRQRMEEQINELRLLTSINALKGCILRGEGRDDAGEPAGALRAFYREFRKLIARDLKLGAGFLILPEEPAAGVAPGHAQPENAEDWIPAPAAIQGRPFAEHPEARKLMRLADKEQVRVEAGDFFRNAYPLAAQALDAAGIALLSLSPDPARPAYLLLRLSEEDVGRLPALRNLLQAVASQARVVAENIDLYDSLLAANRNLTAMQWQLVHSGKMAALGQLAGGVAHEINNPLQIMLGRIQMIQMMSENGKTAKEGDKIRDELHLVTEEVLRIRDIVRNLLDFSRQGKRDAPVSPLDLDDTVKDVLALLRHQLISNQVDVRLSLAGPGGSRVLGNRNQLKQVFINLMMNAIHAMEKEPRILEIATASEGGMVVATVRDSGVGIPSENLARVFEPFFSTKSMGTGLGLSISYGLIKEHKGTMEVESQEGRGTCFTIRLPKLPDESRGYQLLVG